MSLRDFFYLRSGRRPIWLIRLYHAGNLAHFTTLERQRGAADFETPPGVPDVSFSAAQTWLPSAVKLGGHRKTTNLERAQMELSFPVSDDFARGYLGASYFSNSTVTVWEGDVQDPDREFLVRFSGRVVAVAATRREIKLKCETGLSRARSVAQSRIVQRSCGHTLYKGRCGALLADNQVSAAVVGLSGAVATVPDAAAAAAGFYVGGDFQYLGTSYKILNHSGAQLELAEIPKGLKDEIVASGSANVLIARGCRRLMPDCIELGAYLSYGGYHHLEDNPFNGQGANR